MFGSFNCLKEGFKIFEKWRWLALVMLIITCGQTVSSNISLTNTRLTGQDPVEDYTVIEFDVSGDHSRRVSSSPSNWDAVWVFLKFRGTDGVWQHDFLQGGGHTAPAGSAITAWLLIRTDAFNNDTNPCLGVLIYRSADGSGAFAKTDVQLRWKSIANGLGDDDIVDFRVLAIEMVLVPEGSFNLGDATTTNLSRNIEFTFVC